ncbi:hypothetical protein ACMYUJ_19775 [Stutzerimonas zhaodongensis]|uniref:hypothetical protein n=1 Tax=Stutzerimonas zhaodongensis TaxID=1176257 RepID=UPI0039EFB180
MYGISLITHYHGTKAWRVTLFRDGRKVVEKEFPHLTHGSEEAALLAAIAHRDEQMLLHPPRCSRDVREKIRTTNSSGHSGVTRYRMGKYWYWVAQTKRRDGRPMTKSFRIDLLGEEQAKALAVAERARQLSEIDHLVFRSREGELHHAKLVRDSSSSRPGE